ncbi:Disease resistance protein RUN1, partial [Cucurbita argyrosperma subsp. sororia]
MAGSSVFSPNLKWSYDVFLSFRGEDTRSNFTSHLDMALRQKGVNVFIDDKLSRGEQISESLFRSIEGALISIVIFSENYASSSWCLDELVKIIECKKSKGQIVWPIFYKVNPSDIRKQTGSFGEALATHQVKFKTKIQIWREALTTAANSSGWDLGTRKEADLIQDLVKEVLSILNLICTPLYVAKYPVGIDYQLETLRLHSHYWTEPSISVYMVGIYGIGGIGKTTFAKALYNKIANQFEACCFISKVRETSKQFNGLVQLQENLLHEILKEDLKVGNLDRGINIIKHRLCSQKVLIALDDVDKLEQLEALVGGRDWFGPGSIIIVTTRNNHLLSIHEFDQKYGIQGMNHDDALELFSWHAFKKSHPPSAYVDLSKRATSYCKGHPLALVVLGSFLCTRDDEAEWRSILDEFENSLSKDISDILRISFDGLEEKVKEIFLDISCFLVEEKVEYVKNILNACHFNADFGIIVLIDLSLVTIEYNTMQMHDLVRHMAHKIVNGESFEPGKRSRLWLVQDVLKVFADNSGTDAIRAIKLELPNPTKLENLILRNCKFLQKIPSLPPLIERMDATGCESLTRCHNFVDMLSSKQVIKGIHRHFIIMNGEIPEKFYRTISNPMKVSFRHYPNMERTLTTYVMFKVDKMEKLPDQGHAVISFNKCYGDQDKFSFNREFPSSTSEYMWLISITSNISTSSVANGWNHVIVWFDVLKCFAATVTIKNCGIHLTDEIHGIQNDDIRGPGVIYTDFDRLKELVSDE